MSLNDSAYDFPAIMYVNAAQPELFTTDGVNYVYSAAVMGNFIEHLFQ